jgi:hypothetical protein
VTWRHCAHPPPPNPLSPTVRFRSSVDVQYAFAYFFFLIEGGARLGLDPARYWMAELDTDGDGVLSDNEFRTLAAVVYKKAPTDGELADLRRCVAAANVTTTAQTTTTPQRDTVTTTTTTVVHPAVTLARVLACDTAREGLAKNARAEPTHQEMSLDEVAFEMVTDDYNKTLAQLDSVRHRRTKFVCINDDMKEAPAATRAALRDFFASYYAKPSSFELPPGVVNPSLWVHTLPAGWGGRAPQPADTAAMPSHAAGAHSPLWLVWGRLLAVSAVCGLTTAAVWAVVKVWWRAMRRVAAGRDDERGAGAADAGGDAHDA